MSTKSEKKKSYFAPSALAVKFAKAMESAGATPEEINGMSENKEFLQNMLKDYRVVSDLFDPHKFFVNRKGLRFSLNFRDRILSIAKKTQRLPSMKISYFDLPNPMNDDEIMFAFRETHIYEDASEFCFVLASMIDQQSSGQEGSLPVNGKASIFYVRGKNAEIFAVCVDSRSVDREWCVDAYCLSGDKWRVGCRAFAYKR